VDRKRVDGRGVWLLFVVFGLARLFLPTKMGGVFPESDVVVVVVVARMRG